MKKLNLNKFDEKSIWLIIAWILLFPFTLTYLIIKTNKLQTFFKIILLIIMWSMFFTIIIVNNKQEKKYVKDKIIECYSYDTYNKLNEIFGIDNIYSNISSTTSCDNIRLKDSDNNFIDIKINDNKELVYIKVGKNYIYGEESIQYETKSNNTRLEYEFETIEGYTTLQSLIMNINENTKYSQIKKMAYYVGFYISDLSEGEHYGLIIKIYNTNEDNYYNSTESVMLVFDDYKGKKLSRVEYHVSYSSFKYTFYTYDPSKSFVYDHDEGNIKIDNFKDAFSYINDKIGYKK